MRDAFDDILRFWMDRGIAGFRIDVAHGIVKDRELRDNPPATDDDTEHHRWLGQRLEYSMNRDEVHDVFRRWRAVRRSATTAVLLGETWVLDLERLHALLRRRTSTSCTWPSTSSSCWPTSRPRSSRRSSPRPRRCCPSTRGRRGRSATTTWMRFPTRWARGDPGSSRCALMLLLTLRGTPVLYYGDELAMPDAEIPPERDRRSRRPAATTPSVPGRDGARSPMPWSAEPGAGFSAPGVEPWLPLGELAGVNVAEQRADPAPRCTSRATSSPCGARRRTCAPAPTSRSWSRRAVGLPARRRLPGGAQPRLGRGERPGRGHDRDRHAARARRRGVARSLLLAPGEGVVLRAREPETDRAPPVSNRVCRAARVWQDAGPWRASASSPAAATAPASTR